MDCLDYPLFPRKKELSVEGGKEVWLWCGGSGYEGGRERFGHVRVYIYIYIWIAIKF